MKRFLTGCFFAFLLGAVNSWGQTDTLLQAVDVPEPEEPSKSWELRGYVKNMQTWLFLDDPANENFLQDNLIHQRTNFRWFVSDRVRFTAELRTRAFFGDLVRGTEGYAGLVDNANNDYADLSVILLDKPAWVVQSMLDRLYLEYATEKWEVRLGRQRINWGISTVWNPNDLFNAFSFTDFDYEERPGSDALRVRYFTGFAGSVELAVKAFDRWEDAVIAGLWKFNAFQFDGQLLAGYAREDAVLGAGWAGNLGNAGFKGEATYFIPLNDSGEKAFALTLAFDYSFSTNLYVHAGYLYNSLGAVRGDIGGLFGFQLSAKNLYPFRHALFLQAGYPFTPLLNGGAAVIYSPVESRALFLNPSLTLSMAANWDLDLVGQVVANREGKTVYSSPLQAVFLRTRFSF